MSVKRIVARTLSGTGTSCSSRRGTARPRVPPHRRAKIGLSLPATSTISRRGSASRLDAPARATARGGGRASARGSSAVRRRCRCRRACGRTPRRPPGSPRVSGTRPPAAALTRRVASDGTIAVDASRRRARSGPPALATLRRARRATIGRQDRTARRAGGRGRAPRRARGTSRRRARRAGSPWTRPSSAARSEPTASSTARMSSICVSSVSVRGRSERPGAALVEQDQARERRKPLEEAGEDAAAPTPSGRCRGTGRTRGRRARRRRPGTRSRRRRCARTGRRARSVIWPLRLSAGDCSAISSTSAVERHRRDALAAALADGHRLARLAVAPDDDVRHLLELGVADPLAERLVALVDVGAHACEVERADELGGSLAVRLRDREHAHLHRREPDRERAGVVLDQDADEALERAEQRAVDDDTACARRCPRPCT